MTNYTAYWVATMARGLIAVVAAVAVLFLSDVAATILLLPLAVVISILCLAAYVVIDSAIVLASSFMVPRGRPGALALRVQGICGIVIGILLFTLAFNKVRPAWFLYLAALQALFVALAELIVARGTALHHDSAWCYASAGISIVSAAALVSGTHLNHRNLAWLLCAYLGTFGLNLFLLAARMLFEERHLARSGTS
jgi:hypothetical protein